MTIKIGDSFSFAGEAEIVDQAGDLIDMTDWTVNAAGVINDTPVTFDCALIDGVKQTFSIAADTSQWTVGVLRFDVKFTSPSGQSKTTDVASMNIQKGFS